MCITSVEVRNNEPVEKALRRFKRLVDREGVLREWKKREFFEKPSTIKNRKKKSLDRKREKRLRRSNVGRPF